MASTENIRHVDAGDVTIAYETFGDKSDPPVLLVMGFGTQMLGWQEDFCAALAERGHLVVRFDNRDIGLSTHLDDVPAPDLGKLMAGDASQATYLLADMARDVTGLMDGLGLDSAHVVGVSMGGMIVQALAIDHPQRVRSVTSIMSTTGDQSVGEATEQALGVLLAPPARSRDEAIERAVATFRVIGSPGFEFDEAAVRERAALSYDRADDPAGVGRQLAAILASPDRTEKLRELRMPALVIHGADDPLIALSGGRATAAAIPDAELIVIDGMGHDLPREVWPRVVDAIAAVVQRGESARA